MITLVEALNYKCLNYIHRPLEPFHVLVGPNASGKTTFLDVMGFLRDLVSEGLDEALWKRTPNPHELFFQGKGNRFELSIEARIPDGLREPQILTNCSFRARAIVSSYPLKDASLTDCGSLLHGKTWMWFGIRLQ